MAKSNVASNTRLLFPSEQVIEYIKNKAGFNPNVYVHLSGLEMIGYGSINYEDGSRVHVGDDPITEEYADYLFSLTLLYHADTIDRFVTVPLLQQQYDALISFASSVRRQSFKNSVLVRMVNEDPTNIDIAIAFIRWNRNTTDNRFNRELALRRQEEANIYFYAEY